MIEKKISNLVNSLERADLIEKSQREEYEYALLTLTESIIATVTLLIIGFLFRQPAGTVIFLIFFFSLRKRTGGYHADSFLMCYLETAATFVCVLFVAKFFSGNQLLMYILLVLAAGTIAVVGTVNHPNMDMDQGELRESKKRARLVLSFELAVIIVVSVSGQGSLYLGYMSTAIVLCSLLLILAKITKQEVKGNENTGKSE